MIYSIELVNWRSHSKTKLYFKKGTNILVGIMGSGKSSVLEGISYGFFGTFPALERRKMKLDDLIRLNEQEAKIILVFSSKSATYRIERTINRNKKSVSTEAEIYKNDLLVEHGQTAVSTYVSSVLNIDYDLFTRAIYSEQNNVDYFLNIDPKRRKEEIDALLGLDKLEYARANILTVISKLRMKKDLIESQFDKNKLTDLEKNLELQKSSEEFIQKQMELINLQKHTEELSSFQKKYEEGKKTKEVFESLEKEFLRIETLIDMLKSEVSSFDEAAFLNIQSQLNAHTISKNDLISKIKSIESEFLKIKELLSKNLLLSKHAEDIKKKILQIELQITVLEKDSSKDKLLLDEQQLQKELLSLETDFRSLDREIAETTDIITKIKPGQTICILCSSPILDSGHLKKEKEIQCSEKKKKQIEIQNLLHEKKKLFLLHSSKIKKLLLLYEQKVHLENEPSKLDLVKLSSDKNLLEETAEKLASQRTEFQNDLDSLNSEMEKLRISFKEAENKLKKKKDFEVALKKKEDLSFKLKTIHFDKDQFEKLRSDLENKKLDVQKLISEKQNLDLQLNFIAQAKEKHMAEIATIKETESKFQKLSLLEEELLMYKNALLETQIWLRKNLVDAINQAMNEIWSLFYPHKNYEKIRLAATDKDYVLEIYDGTSWKNIETVASGGERSSGALVLRVALSVVLTPQLSWLVLDEPTHNLDKEAVELLSNTLQFSAPQIVNQIFVITHDETLMGSEFASSYKLSRDKANNGETKTEKI